MIDWFTVAAQIVNFLILLALLKRFLYRPILTHMEARRRYIESALSEAGQIQAKAERLIAAYQEKLAALEARRATLLEEARHAAQSERQALLEQARLEVEERRRQWRKALEDEQAAWLRELKALVAEQVIEIARKALQDLAGQELEERQIAAFLHQLATLPDEQRRLLVESEDDWIVATSFALAPERRAQIQAALKQINPKIAVRFEQRKELICGLALEAGGRVWRWHLAAWLDKLEARLQQAWLPVA